MPGSNYRKTPSRSGAKPKGATRNSAKRATPGEPEAHHLQKETTSSSPMIPEGQLPMYLAEAFSELYEEDGLLVLGKGLGWLSLLAVFVRFYGDVEEGHAAIVADNTADATKKDPAAAAAAAKKPPLVIVLGLKDNERKALDSILNAWGTPPDLLPTVITNESGQGKDRASMYKRGGVFCITSRILIVDLLSNVVDAKDIDGLLVTHADQVTDQSTEAFILRIFHSQKLASASLTGDESQKVTGFVKAFTDSPDGLMSGFAKVDKILKALRVRRLYLYPRFHDSIRQELEASPPHVEELHQELSPLMKEIQNAIAAAVQGCIRELKTSTTILEWSDTDLSVENCVTTNFDRAISRQLEHDWHRLKPQTKQLVQDLKTLRTLFQYLIQYDCVSFWKLINSIKTMSAASKNPSMWLLMPAADMLFRKAKERIYKIVRFEPTAKVEKPVSKLQTVLEEPPKWKLLKQVLEEIQDKENEKKETTKQADDGTNNNMPVNVLVMVKDERSLEAIRTYLVDGKSRTMLQRWKNYLDHFNDRSRSLVDSKGGTGAISEESRLLLEEEGRVRRILTIRSNGGASEQPSESTGQSKKRKQLNSVRGEVKKMRKVAAEKGRGGLTSNPDDLERQAVLDEAVEGTEHELGASFKHTTERDGAFNEGEDDWENKMMFEVQAGAETRVILKSYNGVDGDEASLLLQDLRPQYVVLYDSDIAFIRAVEIYAALREQQNDPLRVFFLIFEASAEEKNFMKGLEREQNAFERLVHHKKTMPSIVLQNNFESQEMQQAQSQGIVGGSYMNGALPLAFDSRQGRGKAKPDAQMRDIAVDVREFRSALPSILHQGGMRLAPVTLTVGDFVLSSVHCVERKSISDLFGSFASGRLYTQAEAMCKHYKCPCLLIEFDPNKSFCLQNSNELGVEIRNDSISSKICILTMHFPKLRILWSRSPHDTLKIFKELKAKHDEVDVEKAMEIGRSDSIEALCEEASKNDDGEDEVNEMAREMLLRLPGVTVHSARRIMQECDSLAELCEMSREQLRTIAGPVTGQKLFTFFRQKMQAT